MRLRGTQTVKCEELMQASFGRKHMQSIRLKLFKWCCYVFARSFVFESLRTMLGRASANRDQTCVH